MSAPLPAIVRPRVIAERSRGTVLLEDLVAEIAETGDVASLMLYGPHGAGVTTALRYVEQLLGTQSGLTFIDQHSPAFLFAQRPSAIIRFPTAASPPTSPLKCRLAGWGQDEWIEYLLAAHRGRCKSVMNRIRTVSSTGSLQGNANVWRQVLDLLAADESLPDVQSALIRVIENQFPDPTGRSDVARHIFLAFEDIAPEFKKEDIPDAWLTVNQARLMHIPVIRLLLAREAAWNELLKTDPDRVVHPWPRELIEAVSARIANAIEIQDRLRRWLVSRHRKIHPLAVSLLHAARVDYSMIPLPSFAGVLRTQINLERAYLDGADFNKRNLSRCVMIGASLVEAQLERANLDDANGRSARFDGANFRSAHLTRFNGTKASFVTADLIGCTGKEAVFVGADLSNANLTQVELVASNFTAANLSNAILHRADLRQCDLTAACLDEADFEDANLKGAYLAHLDLTIARFDGASFSRAYLNHCRMESMELPDADFESACLSSAIITGSVMPRANFARAEMRGARLAEVDWEYANLRGADLTGATFHMGSSRSGLVGSSIASYGSKTGFYTDDFNEQDFKSPEEIRKANLRGADLRGAILCGVDFYLVDLRDALYDASQEEQLVRTGAILSCRV